MEVAGTGEEPVREVASRDDHPGPRRTALLVLAAIVIVGAAGAGAALALSGGGGHHKRHKQILVCGNPAGGCTPTPTTNTTNTPTTNTTLAQTEVVNDLALYQNAITNHDATVLANLLAPTVTRRGAGYGSGRCIDSTGKSAVLALYEDQFNRTSAQYRFTNLNRNSIKVTNGTATDSLEYQFSPGATGSVTFTFQNLAGQWRISHISAMCTP